MLCDEVWLDTYMEAKWNRDMDSIEAALAPYAFEIDGELYLTLEAPRNLTDYYRDLTCAGIANGFYR